MVSLARALKLVWLMTDPPARSSDADITATELHYLEYFLDLALSSPRGRDQLHELLNRRG